MKYIKLRQIFSRLIFIMLVVCTFIFSIAFSLILYLLILGVNDEMNVPTVNDFPRLYDASQSLNQDYVGHRKNRTNTQFGYLKDDMYDRIPTLKTGSTENGLVLGMNMSTINDPDTNEVATTRNQLLLFVPISENKELDFASISIAGEIDKLEFGNAILSNDKLYHLDKNRTLNLFSLLNLDTNKIQIPFLEYENKNTGPVYSYQLLLNDPYLAYLVGGCAEYGDSDCHLFVYDMDNRTTVAHMDLTDKIEYRLYEGLRLLRYNPISNEVSAAKVGGDAGLAWGHLMNINLNNDSVNIDEEISHGVCELDGCTEEHYQTNQRWEQIFSDESMCFDNEDRDYVEGILKDYLFKEGFVGRDESLSFNIYGCTNF